MDQARTLRSMTEQGKMPKGGEAAGKNVHMKHIDREKKVPTQVIAVTSGKGGVGKTTVAINLAMSLASVGLRVGILDVDITGPNVIKMLGISSELKPRVDAEAKRFYPIDGPLKLKVMSMAFLTLTPDEPVIWLSLIKESSMVGFEALQ